MGCSQSMQAMVDHKELDNNIAGGTRSSKKEGQRLLASIDLPERQRDFTDDWRILKQIAGAGQGGSSVSSIYMVVRDRSSRQSQRQRQNNSSTRSSMDVIHMLQVMDVKSMAPDRRTAMRAEIQMLKDIRHPNILTVCDVYDTNHRVSMVTELCTGGDLRFQRPSSESRARELVTQILHAVHYMHQRGVYRHNLSTENIMLQNDSPDAVVKIAHAGLSSIHPAACKSDNTKAEPRSDIYSIGMIAFELLSGGREPPTCIDGFDDDGNADGGYAPHLNLFVGRCWRRIRISREAKRFIECCIQPGPRGFTVVKALEHPWITRESPYMKGTLIAPSTVCGKERSGSLTLARDKNDVKTYVSSSRSTPGCVQIQEDGFPLVKTGTAQYSTSEGVVKKQNRDVTPSGLFCDILVVDERKTTSDAFLRETEKENSSRHSHATIIQCFWRICQARRMVNQMKSRELLRCSAAGVIQTRWRDAQRRQSKQESLELTREIAAAISIQSIWRTFTALSLRKKMLAKILVLQSRFRVHLAYCETHNRRSLVAAIVLQCFVRTTASNLRIRQALQEQKVRMMAALLIQTLWRMVRDSKSHLLAKESAMKIQVALQWNLNKRTNARNLQAKLAEWSIVEDRNAAIYIQKQWRVQKQLRQFAQALQGIVLIQSVGRRFLHRRKVESEVSASNLSALKVQSRFRMAHCRSEFHKARSATSLIQQAWRTTDAKRLVNYLKVNSQRKAAAASKIQLAVRTCQTREKVAKMKAAREMLHSVVVLQSAVRSRRAYQLYSRIRDSAMLIQSSLRMHSGRSNLRKTLLSVVAIQRTWKKCLARDHVKMARQSNLRLASVIVLQQFVRKSLSNRFKLLPSVISMQSIVRVGPEQAKNHVEKLCKDETEAETEATVDESSTQFEEEEHFHDNGSQVGELSTSSTPFEFANLHSIFHKCDEGAGETKSIKIEVLKRNLRTGYTEKEVDAWFRGGNFDDSRNINYTEFLAQVIRSRRKTDRLRVKEAFQRIDKGLKGFVTVGNLRAVLGTDNSEHIEQLIKEADTHRDGRITYVQFQEVLSGWNKLEV